MNKKRPQRAVTFSHDALSRVRIYLNSGYRMARICALLSPWYSRDQIVEAIDALHRSDSIHEAIRRVNQVLAHQALETPLINGMPADDVTRRRYAADF